VRVPSGDASHRLRLPSFGGSVMIVIDSTYNGPPGSGHGGVAAGRFAELLDPHRARVRLHAFVPLGTPLRHDWADDGAVVVSDGANVIATVHATGPIKPPTDLPVPALDAVATAEENWDAVHRDHHPYPTCFGCGPLRPVGDGLHLRPGPLAGFDVHATTWRPEGDRPTPAWLIWAALDCGSAGPAATDVPDGVGVVTGELAVDISEVLPPGTTALIISRATARDARKTQVTAALIDAQTGRLYAAASSVWFTLTREHRR
jgi:hypothetical protein